MCFKEKHGHASRVCMRGVCKKGKKKNLLLFVAPHLISTHSFHLGLDEAFLIVFDVHLRSCKKRCHRSSPSLAVFLFVYATPALDAAPRGPASRRTTTRSKQNVSLSPKEAKAKSSSPFFLFPPPPFSTQRRWPRKNRLVMFSNETFLFSLNPMHQFIQLLLCEGGRVSRAAEKVSSTVHRIGALEIRDDETRYYPKGVYFLSHSS